MRGRTVVDDGKVLPFHGSGDNRGRRGRAWASTINCEFAIVNIRVRVTFGLKLTRLFAVAPHGKLTPTHATVKYIKQYRLKTRGTITLESCTYKLLLFAQFEKKRIRMPEQMLLLISPS